jgi:hypothetical protein
MIEMLKPCPFCGKKNAKPIMYGPEGLFAVNCECGAGVRGFDQCRQDAIDAWNARRSAVSAQPVGLERPLNIALKEMPVGDVMDHEAAYDLFEALREATANNWHEITARHLAYHQKRVVAASQPARTEPQSASMASDDPTASKEWNDGCDFAMTQLCKFLDVEPSSVSWDAATETVEGDVSAVIGNILRAKFGEDWGPQCQEGSDGEYVKLANEHLARCMDENQALLARIEELTCPHSQAGIEQRHMAQLLTVLDVMKSAHNKEPGRLMSIWSRDIEAVEAAVAALTRPLRPDEPAISSHQRAQG